MFALVIAAVVLAAGISYYRGSAHPHIAASRGIRADRTPN